MSFTFLVFRNKVVNFLGSFPGLTMWASSLVFAFTFDLCWWSGYRRAEWRSEEYPQALSFALMCILLAVLLQTSIVTRHRQIRHQIRRAELNLLKGWCKNQMKTLSKYFVVAHAKYAYRETFEDGGSSLANPALRIRSKDVPQQDVGQLKSWNLVAAHHGTVHAVACSMVGVFRFIEMPSAQHVVALVAFGEALVYFYLQIKLIKKLRQILPEDKHPSPPTTLTVLWTLALVSFLIFQVCFIYRLFFVDEDDLNSSWYYEDLSRRLEDDSSLWFDVCGVTGENVFLFNVSLMYAIIAKRMSNFVDNENPGWFRRGQGGRKELENRL